MIQPPLDASGFTSSLPGIDCKALIAEALGPGVDDPNSGLLAFAYLWRRFGPPMRGSDAYKDLCAYILTTGDPEVWIWLRVTASELRYSAKALARESISGAIWFEYERRRAHISQPVSDRVRKVVKDAYRELLRPVPVRDIYINIFGRVPDDAVVDPVEPPVYAGYGIPLDAIKLDKETDQ